MGIREVARTARKRWKLVAVPALICMLLAYGLAASHTATYQATARLFFNVSAGNSATDMNQASTYLDREMTSYEEVLTTPLVLQPVIDKLHLNTTPEDLRKRTTTASQAGSTLMDVSVTSTSAAQSAQLANELAQQMTKITAEVSPSPAGADKAVNATVVQPATTPTVPMNVSKMMLALLGLLGGLLLGLVAAVVVERFSRRPQSAADVENAASLHLAGQICEGPHGPSAADIDALRAHLQVRWQGDALLRDQPAVLLVTPDTVGAGASTIANGLARSFAADGSRVLLVDADPAGGLTSLLGQQQIDHIASNIDLDTLAQVHPGVRFMPSATQPLTSTTALAVYRAAAPTFDVILVDSAPVSASPLTLVLGSLSHTALLVARVGRSQKAEITAAAECLEGAVRRTVLAVANGTVAPRAAKK